MENPSTVIDISPVLEPLIQIVGIALAAGVALLMKKLWNLLGVKEDAEVRVYVKDAMQSAIARAVEEGGKFAAGHRTLDIKSRAVAAGAQYMVDHVPDGLQKLGLTDKKGVVTEKLKDVVEAQIARLDQKPGGIMPVTIMTPEGEPKP